jgi:hypothetical protein
MLRRNGIAIDPSVELPDCPAELTHLVEWYTELRVWGRPGMSGPASIVWSDAQAWAAAMLVRPRPSEWRIIMQLDQRYLAAAAKHRGKAVP